MKVIIIGAGPGGLTSAMLLAHRGFEVHVYEKDSVVGGRNKPLVINDFVFDTGPTFLMMKYVLDKVFRMTGRDSSDYLSFVKLDPMYRLLFHDKSVLMSPDHKKTADELRRVFGVKAVEGFYKYLDDDSKKLKYLTPCFEKPYSSFFDLLKNPFLKAIPHLDLHTNIFNFLEKYFSDDDLKLCFTFQSKYLGMSAWECPAAFSMIAYVEHELGIYHVIGGLNKIAQAMAKVVEEEGGVIHLNSPVKKLIQKNNRIEGIVLEDGSKVFADYFVLNADFAYAADNLFKTKKYSHKNLMKKKYSCSTFMLYLGVDKLYNIPHHNIVFAKDYKRNVDDIFNRKVLSEDISLYIQNPSAIDDTLAPKGQSSIYVLVPVPNLKADIDWVKEKSRFRDLILSTIEQRTELKDLRKHIVAEKIITPLDWLNDYNVFLGATFNLAHNLTQMLCFRPHNDFECFDNVFLVGGGTHPGSGLPTIYESGIISANFISKK